MAIGRRFWQWLGFGVVVALLPIFFETGLALITAKEPTLETILGTGELLLVSGGLSAAAVGELILFGERWETFKILATTYCVVNIAFTSFCYPFTSGKYSFGLSVDTGAVVLISPVSYGSAVACGGLCVYLSERSRPNDRS